jgi:hypothetical protein
VRCFSFGQTPNGSIFALVVSCSASGTGVVSLLPGITADEFVANSHATSDLTREDAILATIAKALLLGHG